MSPYLGRPLRTLAEAQRDLERAEARRRLRPLGIAPIDYFKAERTILNPPPAWLAPAAHQDDADGPLVGGERALVRIAWGFVAALIAGGGFVAWVSG